VRSQDLTVQLRFNTFHIQTMFAEPISLHLEGCNYMRESTRSSHHFVTPYRFRVVCQILHARNAAAGVISTQSWIMTRTKNRISRITSRIQFRSAVASSRLSHSPPGSSTSTLLIFLHHHRAHPLPCAASTLTHSVKL